MIIVFLGAPGAGKGTQSQMLSAELSIPQLSTGDIFRAALKEGTEIGLQAKSYMDAGNLVPDDVVLKVIEERILADDCKGGFILDGFPRTVGQAEGLEKMLQNNNLSLDQVVCLEVDEDTVVARQAGRLHAPKSGKIYHAVNHPPKVAGKCDVTGEDLVKRDDDSEDVVRHRMSVYREQTAPVKDFYAKSGQLSEFDGAEAVETVFAKILTTLRKAA